ncbi:MAG: hypothetical protein ACRDYZ_16470 [Acidimicrobiales bacterium]
MTVTTEEDRVAAPAPGRLALQAERRHERRQRLLLALSGLLVLTLLLAATVIMVGVVR